MEKAKEIIATFINNVSENIHSTTVIDKTAVKSSILVHRMYAALSKNGFKINDYLNIKTFGDLQNALGDNLPKTENKSINVITNQINNSSFENFTNSGNIGIDIEMVDEMPLVPDFREAPFYLDNFTGNEISYCLLAASPIHSFTGLFSVKEAICKSDNKYRTYTFKDIEIMHDKNGKPIFNGFDISISQTKEYVVSVALRTFATTIEAVSGIESGVLFKGGDIVTSKKSNRLSLFISVIALIISIIAFFINKK